MSRKLVILNLRCFHSSLFYSSKESLINTSNLIAPLEAAQGLCVSSGPCLAISFTKATITRIRG